MANLMNQPMYQRIKEDILHQIKTNLLSPGDRLPTEYQLMDHYQVSRITVSKALSELKSEGVIERFPNKGSFVSRLQEAPPLANETKLPEELAPMLIVAIGKPAEEIVIREIEPGEPTPYYRDEQDVHYVPKRKLADIVIH